MRCPIFDIEVTRPLSEIQLSPEDAGVAILVRRKGVPIGFWLQETNGSKRISAEELGRKIAAGTATKIVAEAIREEMVLPRSAVLPSLTIAICTKDRPEGVERLLESLREQLAAPCERSTSCEILLIDNASFDERTREVAAKHPYVRYLYEPRPGLDFARNRALQEANGELLAFLDDDVVVDKYWSIGLAEAWTENRDAVAFTGQVFPMELETKAQIVFEIRGGFRRGFERIRYGPELPGTPLYPGGAGMIGAGANMAFRTEALRQMGGFDEALDTGRALPGGGDLDIFYRVIRAGHPLIYEPRYLVFHQHRREMKALHAQYRRSWGLGFMCYVRKCLRTDPDNRVNLLLLIHYWFKYEMLSCLQNLKKKLCRQPYAPPSLFLSELWGGAIGLFGGYTRSLRRIEKIRQRFP